MELRYRPVSVVRLMLLLLMVGGGKWALVNCEGFKADVPTHLEKVLVNETAQIKCDVSSNLTNDRILLVVWYKDNVPIYSYDTRGPHVNSPSHWKDVAILEDRANFKTTREQSRAVLVISPVQKKDAGIFRCRVDFLLSPTKNSNVNLEIVVPPDVPKIHNEAGVVLPSHAGPYEEGGDLVLICVVTGGNPTPKITWSSNGKTLPSAMIDYAHESTLSSRLVVRNLSRAHQHNVYSCQASNFYRRNVTANVTIELRLRPLAVEIVNGSSPLSADRRYIVQCQSVGSRPPAKITWWMGGVQLTATNQTTSEDGNSTLASLSFTPTREDHGKTLICRATNELVKRGTKETSMKLNVFYLPTLKLELGINMNPEDIEEGDDVYFECKVNANPSAYKVVWKHNDKVVQHNSKSGVIMSSTALALQTVTRHQAGNYTCIASNVEGDGESNTVDLKVMYKPICRPDQKKIYGVARNEAAEILCQVDAYPPPESFKWSFNNTAETIDMPQSGYRVHAEQASSLTYTPVKELDYGTIMCWADNVVGQQKEPCVFHLIAAGKPEMPYNCSLVNQTSESLEVDCAEGFDGGQRQWFVMEIYDLQSHALLANVSSKLPIFTVNGLDAGLLLKIVIYATNMRGRSEPILLQAYTLKAAEKQTGPHAEFELTPIVSIGIFIGILTVLICIIIAVAAAFKLRATQAKQHTTATTTTAGGKRPGNLPIKEKISLPLSQSEDMYDEKNPDVVPSNEDPDYKLISANQTPTALHNSLCNSKHDIIGRTILDDSRKTYLTGSASEVHYAELALAIPHDDTGGKTHLNNHLNKLPPPPAYNYFDEPTIYAQIDHGGSFGKGVPPPPTQSHPGSTIAGVGSTGSSSFPLISPVSQQQQHHHHHHPLTLQLQQDATQPAPPHNQHHAPHTPHTPTTASLLQLSQPLGQHPGAVLAHSPLQLSHALPQSPSASLPSANGGGGGSKQYLREIVTVRTPLAFSQQESCV
ncbi:hemicentin-1 isoform X1 [Anopheles arabiensis]|uniref:Ig-like domain-containing protein n=1 Tax=Anopheles gambiae TaxID=7165 RepID=A0A1S4GDS9_ANOGA|nr:hemicentin-1 isoform X1 [Anopheles arabiensis]XP_040153574.1 hemicentin-1 isoform X1 [Anopheles arabiensis]XP_040153575.1 hemicentin-1 isoform X1 [Anopheles arabiensis]XP_061499040.1 hemicentin-1 isoform X1 [Anopheles gambiae]XP_061499041.1 hemicentin-1 isoform X1 [Anopheles gambiae]XP_061499042.1 hemicentin-1 isoform X1 [Anopheles gambiae]XP_061499043.1 hemicentin-1 isoform X1 [Anopheles gambiae]XP_061499044.1 hemicentin-1 isoform X1 [Anopheles gambiae]